MSARTKPQSHRSLTMSSAYSGRTLTLLLASSAVWLTAFESMAHHSMAAFDKEQWSTMTGALVAIDYRNPHIFLDVAVENDGGELETWSFEGPAPSTLRAMGFFKADFEASLGQDVTVEASPARDGSNSGLLRQVTLADGAFVSACPQYC